MARVLCGASDRIFVRSFNHHDPGAFARNPIDPGLCASGWKVDACLKAKERGDMRDRPAVVAIRRSRQAQRAKRREFFNQLLQRLPWVEAAAETNLQCAISGPRCAEDFESRQAESGRLVLEQKLLDSQRRCDWRRVKQRSRSITRQSPVKFTRSREIGRVALDSRLPIKKGNG